MKVISIATEKGGTGKTTTAQALIETLRANNFKVLGVDLDTQGNLTFSFNSESAPYSVYEFITGRKSANDVIYNDFIKATNLINLLDNEKPTALKEALEQVKGKYDFVIIDTPPKLDKTLIKALVCSNYVILPTQAEAYAIKGIDKIFNVIKTIQSDTKNGNANLKILGILLTMYNDRSNLFKQLKELLESKTKANGTRVFITTIHKSVAIAEAQALKEPLLSYKNGVKAVDDYKELTKEILEIIK